MWEIQKGMMQPYFQALLYHAVDTTMQNHRCRGLYVHGTEEMRYFSSYTGT